MWLVASGGPAAAAGKAAAPVSCIQAETVADYVDSLIEADRVLYTPEVVERMQQRGIVFPGENWREAGKLPLRSQFLPVCDGVGTFNGGRTKRATISASQHGP
jgi:hypothetical protein